MAKSTLKVAGVYQNLARIGEFVTSWAQVAGLDERAVYAVEMSVDEACSNIIQYAYGGEGKGDIHLHCQKLSDGLKITIIDQGNSFDPHSVAKPNLHGSLAERSEGGLGIFLMRKLMDEVNFHFEPKKNTLVMIKRQGVTS